jgi:hypothetical protein
MFYDNSLPTAKITNPDVTRIINSDEIQSVVRPAKDTVLNARGRTKRKNPLVNKSALYRLNPYAKTLKVNELGTFSVQISFTAYRVSYSWFLCFSIIFSASKSCF